jgi:hypothetical protein
MALCPFCHDEKFMFAPVCTNCNNGTPLLFQLGCSLLASVLPLAMFVGFFFFLGWLITP